MKSRTIALAACLVALCPVRSEVRADAPPTCESISAKVLDGGLFVDLTEDDVTSMLVDVTSFGLSTPDDAMQATLKCVAERVLENNGHKAQDGAEVQFINVGRYDEYKAPLQYKVYSSVAFP